MGTPLHIREISYLICENLDRASLARLARTASAFKQPALDVLYCQKIDINVLIRCFPHSLLTMQQPVHHVFPVLLRDLEDEDVPRIMVYFERIKNLSLSECDDRSSWKILLEQLALKVPCFFPTVRNLWINTIASFPSDPSLNFAAELRAVSFDSSMNEVIEKWLTVMVNRCPKLRRIRFNSRSSLPCEVWSLFPLFENLVEVVVRCPLSDGLFEILGTCLVLDSLDFTGVGILNSRGIHIPSSSFPSLHRLMLPSIHSPQAVPSFAAGAFPQLQSITASEIPPIVAEQLLQAFSICAAQLVSFTADLAAFSTPDHFRSLFSQLNHWSRTLEKVHISAEDGDFIGDTWHFGHVCVPLLPLNRLKRLILWIGPGFSMSDQDTSEIGKHWKNLYEFRILLSCTSEARSSFQGLVEMASECVDLTIAVIPISYEQVPPLPKAAYNNNLRELSVGRAPIEDAVAVADFLKAAFPYLKTIGPDTVVPAPYDQRWHRVKELLADQRFPQNEIDEASDISDSDGEWFDWDGLENSDFE
ncbi:hypothetical protein DL96DRAFT_1621709 [Flagelloscypha sp. PMI_526]|nr:hypothetical protein DL96DRAFT_1621709 [Flagelloscypha sp. PMI_526]